MIGGFFQCYKNPLATYKTLESFRKHYPTSPIVLLSDNGYNYENMATHFNCIYIHSNESITFWINYENDEQYFNQTKKLIQRIIDAFKLLNCEYVLFLEDDVKVHNAIPNELLNKKRELYGNNPNTICKEMMDIFQQTYPFIESRLYHYSGHGGSFYKRDSCIEIFSNEKIVNDIIKAFTTYRGTLLPTNINQDQVFSLAIILSGGHVEKIIGHIDIDTPYKPQGLCFNQHQFKYYYNKELPPELQHLVKMS